MANKVAELFAEFRIAFNKGTLDIVNTTFGELRIGTLAEIASLAGLTKMLFSVGEHAVKTASHLHMLGKAYGLNTTLLQDMTRAGLAANVSASDMEAGITSLQSTLADLNLGQISEGFLQAAGFFGLRVGPGMTQKDIENQMMKLVPQFIKMHGGGEQATAMAGNLIERMGMPRSMLQYFMGGKVAQPGKDVNERLIDSLTKTSNRLQTLSYDISNLSINYIEPLVDSLIPIGQAAAEWASQFGTGITASAKVMKTPGGPVDDLIGAAMSPLTYMSQSDAKAKEREYLFSKRYPVQSKFFPPWLTGSRTYSEGEKVDFNSKTTVNFYGVEDQKIAKTAGQAVKNANETHTRNFASAINRYKVPEGGQAQKSTP